MGLVSVRKKVEVYSRRSAGRTSAVGLLHRLAGRPYAEIEQQTAADQPQGKLMVDQKRGDEVRPKAAMNP